MYSYRTHDLAFFHAMDRGLVLATVAGSAMERAMTTALTALLAVGREVIADVQAPHIPYDGKESKTAMTLYVNCERIIRTTWAAYAEAATLAGFDPQELLLLNPLSANVQAVLASGTENADPEKLQQFKSVAIGERL